MRISDAIAIGSYIGIVANLIILSYYLNRSVGTQIKSGILLYVVLFTSSAAFSLGGVAFLLLFNRVEFVGNGEPTPRWVSDVSAYLWLWFCLSLTGLSFLYVTGNTGKYIPFGRRKGD